MRRREESLGFWLRHNPGTHDRRIKAGAVLGSWLGVPPLSPATQDLSFEAAIQEGLCTELSIQEPCVLDGLGFTDQCGSDSTSDVEEDDSASSGIRDNTEQHENTDAKKCTEFSSLRRKEATGNEDADLRQAENIERSPAASLPGEAVVSEHLPNVEAVEFSWMDSPVMNTPPIPAPSVMFRTLLKATEARLRFATLLDRLPSVTDGAVALLPEGLPVLVGTPRFTRLPHSRSSVDLGTLGAQESERLLHEAETVRGMPHGQGELLALFLNIPVEMVSRVRFVEEGKQVLYTLTSKPDLMRTRVHDMLAVRDRDSGEIHLVPHRTRYRMAFLA